jgi:hypothetical protein
MKTIFLWFQGSCYSAKTSSVYLALEYKDDAFSTGVLVTMIGFKDS